MRSVALLGAAALLSGADLQGFDEMSLMSLNHNWWLRAQKTGQETGQDHKQSTCLANDAAVVVIGGGPSGVHMAMSLKQRGYSNVVVLEKHRDENRFGKTDTVKLEETGDIPHELGTCYLSSSYIRIRELFQKYVGEHALVIPGQDKYNKLMLPSPKVLAALGLPDPSVDLFDMQWFAMNVNRHKKWMETKDPATYEQVMGGEIMGYIALHKDIFGVQSPRAAHGLPPSPKPDKKHLIDKTYYEFMTENGFSNLLDYLAIGMGSYGFGFDIPALYGLIFVNQIVAFNVINPDPAKPPIVQVVKEGFSNLWQQIVQQEGIDLRRGHEVTDIRQVGDGYKVSVRNTNVDASKTSSFHADELFFATPINEFMTETVLANPSGMERQMAQHMRHVGLNVNLYKAPSRSLKIVQSLTDAPMPFPDQALEFFPEPLQKVLTPVPNGELYAERNDGLSYDPDTYEGLASRYVMTYQHFPNNSFDVVQANARAKEQVGQDAEFKVGRAYKEYFPHFDQAAVRNNLPWKIFNKQGRQHKWYIGSAVVFESTEDVVTYNEQVLARASSFFCTLAPGSIIAMTGGKDGKYCSDDWTGIQCNRDHLGSWEKFTIVDAGDGKIALRGGNRGRYCTDFGSGIKCNAKRLRKREMFTVVNIGGGKIALQGGKDGKYCADEQRKVSCNRKTIDSWETFTIQQIE